ncbi:MAG: hypothetical protein HC836_36380 [Richelia sp. RM2_1_2]|nr:hypothetical protein [Richelia sp. RM2_1_2]
MRFVENHLITNKKEAMNEVVGFNAGEDIDIDQVIEVATEKFNEKYSTLQNLS